MCGGRSAPAPAPPPPPPAPPPIPSPVRNEQGAALSKSASQRAALAAGGGTQASTILTGGLGLTGSARSRAKKTLLGT
jgi:hypothetical protein